MSICNLSIMKVMQEQFMKIITLKDGAIRYDNIQHHLSEAEDYCQDHL